MLALALAVFAGAASMRCLDALLPELAASFGRSVGSVGSVVSAYAFGYGMSQLLCGSLADRIGIVRSVAGAIWLSACAALACSFAASLEQLVALRFVAGGFAAAIAPLTLTWVSRVTPWDRRPVALARVSACAIVGTAAGQFGGGVLGGLAGVTAVFTATSALFVVSGAALVATAGPEATALTVGGSDPDPRPHGRRARMGASIAPILIAVGVECFAVHLSLPYAGVILHDRLGLATFDAGLVLSLFGAGGILFALTAGFWQTRTSLRRRAGMSGVLLFFGFAALACCSSSAGAAASLLSIGYGFLMMHNVLQTVASGAGTEALARRLSWFAAAATLAQGLGAASGGFVVDRAGSAAVCLWSAITLAVLGLVVGRIVGKTADLETARAGTG